MDNVSLRMSVSAAMDTTYHRSESVFGQPHHLRAVRKDTWTMALAVVRSVPNRVGMERALGRMSVNAFQDIRQKIRPPRSCVNRCAMEAVRMVIALRPGSASVTHSTARLGTSAYRCVTGALSGSVCSRMCAFVIGATG